jgi:hypothetical protein
MKSLEITTIALVFAIVGSVAVCAQTASRNVSYHSQDIVPIRAKVKYTTLIVVPSSEKIMEAATGDKDFWIVDVVGNFCFVHPAKAGISSNLKLRRCLSTRCQRGLRGGLRLRCGGSCPGSR